MQQHATLDHRFKHSLSARQRQGDICERKFAKLIGYKALARHAGKRRKHRFVYDIPGANLVINHVLTGNFGAHGDSFQ